MATKADVSQCGSCGNVFKRAEGTRYTNLCADCHNPHQLITRHGPGDMFRCDYCGQTGTDAQLRSTDCAHFYPPCESCHEHPFCAKDCAAIAEVLSQPGIHLVGFGPEIGDGDEG